MAWVPRDLDQESSTSLLVEAYEQWPSDQYRRLLAFARAAYVAGMTSVADPSPDTYDESPANEWLVEIIERGRG